MLDVPASDQSWYFAPRQSRERRRTNERLGHRLHPPISLWVETARCDACRPIHRTITSLMERPIPVESVKEGSPPDRSRSTNGWRPSLRPVNIASTAKGGPRPFRDGSVLPRMRRQCAGPGTQSPRVDWSLISTRDSTTSRVRAATEATPSFAIRLVRWRLTERSSMPRSPAICLFSSPRRT